MLNLLFNSKRVLTYRAFMDEQMAHGKICVKFRTIDISMKSTVRHSNPYKEVNDAFLPRVLTSELQTLIGRPHYVGSNKVSFLQYDRQYTICHQMGRHSPARIRWYNLFRFITLPSFSLWLLHDPRKSGQVLLAQLFHAFHPIFITVSQNRKPSIDPSISSNFGTFSRFFIAWFRKILKKLGQYNERLFSLDLAQNLFLSYVYTSTA